MGVRLLPHTHSILILVDWGDRRVFLFQITKKLNQYSKGMGYHFEVAISNW